MKIPIANPDTVYVAVKDIISTQAKENYLLLILQFAVQMVIAFVAVYLAYALGKRHEAKKDLQAKAEAEMEKWDNLRYLRAHFDSQRSKLLTILKMGESGSKYDIRDAATAITFMDIFDHDIYRHLLRGFFSNPILVSQVFVAITFLKDYNECHSAIRRGELPRLIYDRLKESGKEEILDQFIDVAKQEALLMENKKANLVSAAISTKSLLDHLIEQLDLYINSKGTNGFEQDIDSKEETSRTNI